MKTTGVRVAFKAGSSSGKGAVTLGIVVRGPPAGLESADCPVGCFRLKLSPGSLWGATVPHSRWQIPQLQVLASKYVLQRRRESLSNPSETVGRIQESMNMQGRNVRFSA